MARKELNRGRTGGRLHLDRETIRQLDEARLDQVVGGDKVAVHTNYDYTCLTCLKPTTWQTVSCPWTVTC